MEQLRIGIIGMGWPGQRHIEAYQKHPNAKIVALSDVNTAAAEAVRDQYKVEGARIFGDYQEMLSGDHVDAVSIATPNFLHVPMAIAAMEAGKHVLLEKPLSNTLADGERLAAVVAERPQQAFMIALNNRYRPDNINIRSKIDAGELGEIYYAKTGWLRGAGEFFLSGWFTQKERSGGGPLIDLGVHMLDLALWFMGNPRPVSVSGSVYQKFGEHLAHRTGTVPDVEDFATAFVRLDNGATIVFDVSWVSHIEESDRVYTHLFGTEGGVTIDRRTGPTFGRVEDTRIIRATGRDATRSTLVERPMLTAPGASDPMYQLYESFRGEVADFVDSVLAGRQPGATITHGLDLLRVLDGIYRSAQTGKQIDLSAAVADDPVVEPGDAVEA